MSQTLPSTANVSPRPDVHRVIHEASINHSVSPAGTGGQKHRSALVADGQHTWSFTNPDPSLRRPSPTTLPSDQTAGPSTPMFGAPPLSYDPAHAIEPQDTVDYQQFIQTHFPTGGQMDYQLQTGHIGNALYPQQLQEMQEMLQPQPQNHFNFVQSQFVSQNQGAYDQSFAPGPTRERLQRRLPRTTRQQPVTKAPVPTQFVDTPHSQLSQHVQASTVMDASFQQQSFTFTHDTPPETYLYANDSRIMSHETLPRQQYRFSEYQHPDQQIAATGPPYAPSELNSYSSSPVSIAEDNPQNSQFVSPQQAQTPMAVSIAPNAQASPGQSTGRKAQDKAGKGREKATNQKKRGRTEMRESDSPSDEDEFANIIVPPVTGNELPNRLCVS
ncbi:uncharacterized protein LAESUDRAFT_763224 [Laetiporus sulphureus 93-53]|uniref:Uncharacterized protein n=1 Tax=Laetiporus sulphureus 93-53 TaxID=1314785 RepID=A0A165BZV1_9APHY|nr:uncharacterized protein LAESUDRAFT_763224 [Laetiporus sulphureus 93-53]KZT01947.1 hypothetical protein LAESUDRAFT_763224 [Laetiporus sulphureus 93-53]